MICDRLGECLEKEAQNSVLKDCCNSDKEHCIIVSDNRRFVKCEENNRRYTLENTQGKHVTLMQMDGGIIKSDRNVPQGISKCDYLFAIGADKEALILTELKGVDVKKALQQIGDTLKRFSRLFTTYQHVYGRIIITSSVPRLRATPEYVRLATALKGDFGGNLKVFERQHVEKDTELGRA